MPRRKFNQKFKRKAPSPKTRKCFAHGVTLHQLREDEATKKKEELESEEPGAVVQVFLCDRCHKWHIWRHA